MVRLVFRPYTQIWRTICTSVSQQASIRVSSDFTLSRNRSPSFGSWYHYFGFEPFYLLFILHSILKILLAVASNSLVRVSRRVNFSAHTFTWTSVSRYLLKSQRKSFHIYGFKSFNSPFGVLFIFPSRYLSTIGLPSHKIKKLLLPSFNIYFQRYLLTLII